MGTRTTSTVFCHLYLDWLCLNHSSHYVSSVKQELTIAEFTWLTIDAGSLSFSEVINTLLDFILRSRYTSSWWCCHFTSSCRLATTSERSSWCPLLAAGPRALTPLSDTPSTPVLHCYADAKIGLRMYSKGTIRTSMNKSQCVHKKGLQKLGFICRVEAFHNLLALPLGCR